MNIVFDLLIVFGLLSSVLNVTLFLFLRKTKKVKPQLTLDARAILSDLASGPALIKVEYVDRGDVLLRSPRHLS